MFGDVAPDQQRPTMIEIADAIGSCNCNVDIPLVRALLYLFERGPD